MNQNLPAKQTVPQPYSHALAGRPNGAAQNVNLLTMGIIRHGADSRRLVIRGLVPSERPAEPQIGSGR